MHPDRWAEVERIFHAAAARPAGERAAFLRDACGDDDALRGEVESLLAQPAEADRKYRLGFMGIATPDTFFGAGKKELLAELARLGYLSGTNLEVVECYELESPEKLSACAVKLAGLPVDAIVTEGTTSTLFAP